MKVLIKSVLCFFGLLFLSFSSGALSSSTSSEALQQVHSERQIYNKRELALLTQRAFMDTELFERAIEVLEKNPVGVSVDELAQEIQTTGVSTNELSTLRKRAEHSCFRGNSFKSNMSCNRMLANGVVEVPELWLYKPPTFGKVTQFDEVLFAFPPSGNEHSWVKVEAYDRFGNSVFLDPKVAPEVPVIVLETQGGIAFDAKVALINDALKKAGLQSSHAVTQPLRPIQAETALRYDLAASEDTTKLNKIRLNDDEEPWIKGAAEIYMITSGVKNSDNEAELRITPLHYLDEEDKNYYPNQIVLFWNDYSYNAANIQLWEDDGGTNYQELVSALIQAIGRAGGLFGLPELTAVTEIAAIIVEAMPSNWWSDDDDFVDTCYTIERNQSYFEHYCTRGNAKVDLVPFELTSSR